MKIEKPDSTVHHAGEIHAWVDREPPCRIGPAANYAMYCDLAPSRALLRSADCGDQSCDAFVTAYEMELDLIPADRFALLTAKVRVNQLSLTSTNTLAAHTLWRYLKDMAAMQAADDERLNAAAYRCLEAVEKAFQTRSKWGSDGSALSVAGAAEPAGFLLESLPAVGVLDDVPTVRLYPNETRCPPLAQSPSCPSAMQSFGAGLPAKRSAR